MTTKIATKRTGGRPRSFDRNAALKNALDVFWRHGYEGASIACLTSAMGINPPSLYAAFGSKEKLYRETLDYYIINVSHELRASLMQAGSTYEVVRQTLLASARLCTRKGCPLGCMLATGLLRGGEEMQDIIRETSARRAAAQQALAQRLAHASTCGEIASDTDVGNLAAYYASVMQGMSVQALDGATYEQLEKIVELAMNVWPRDRVSAYYGALQK